MSLNLKNVIRGRLLADRRVGHVHQLPLGYAHVLTTIAFRRVGSVQGPTTSIVDNEISLF